MLSKSFYYNLRIYLQANPFDIRISNMNIRLLFYLLLTFQVSGVYAQEMSPVRICLCHTDKTYGRVLSCKTGFDKSYLIAPNKTFLAKSFYYET